MTNAPLPDRISRINEWFGHLLIEPFPWRLYGKRVNQFRREIGLPPQTNRQNIAARRRMTVVHGVSRHVMPFPLDWPANFHIAGYWFLDEHLGWEPPAEVAEFLAAGPTPICIGFGSMTDGDPEGTSDLIIEAVRQSGQRAILLAGWTRMTPERLPPEVQSLSAAPHGWLFPRMAAVVHHGGAGTTAAGLLAGVPSVIVPHMADQPYWGHRVWSLGVGPRPVPRHKLTAANLASAIRHAVTDEAMKRRAIALGARIREEDGLGCAVDVVRKAVGT